MCADRIHITVTFAENLVGLVWGANRGPGHIMVGILNSSLNHDIYCRQVWWVLLRDPREQGLWGQHGAHMGPTGPRWAPCWPHGLCYLGNWVGGGVGGGNKTKNEITTMIVLTFCVFSIIQNLYSRDRRKIYLRDHYLLLMMLVKMIFVL